MSWQSDLHRYMELDNKIAVLESRESECSCAEFSCCSLHSEIEEVCIEQNRLMSLWGRLWAVKLYRAAQGAEPLTPVYFGTEAANVEQS